MSERGIKMELVKKSVTKNQCQLCFEYISNHEHMIISPLNIVIRDTYHDFEEICKLPIGYSIQVLKNELLSM